MTRGTELVDAVIDALNSITTANAFKTDPTVFRGRADGLSTGDIVLPAIAIATLASTPTNPKPRTVRKDREINITGLINALPSDYEPALDDLDEDIIRALLPLTEIDALPGVLQIQLSGGEYAHPEGGSNMASVSYTLTVSYSLTIPKP